MVCDFLRGGVKQNRTRYLGKNRTSHYSGIHAGLFFFIIQCVVSFTHNILITIGTSVDRIFLPQKVTRGDG